VEKIDEYINESELSDEYELLSREELSYKVRKLEEEVDNLRHSLAMLKKQIHELL
jgi:archaellum component FlaC